MTEKHISSILDEKNQEEFMGLVIDTFEKQLSKRPVYHPDGGYTCSECEGELRTCYAFCPSCGQKIDWGE